MTALPYSEEIIYETKSGKTKVAVKKIDGVIKLVLNGTYVHSVYNPDQLITREDYWDLMLLGRAFLNRDPKTLCVLGLGGGTVVHLFEKYLRPVLVDAVELDPVIVSIARRFFDLTYENLNVHVGDAKEFIKSTVRHYDIIVVDVFNPIGQEESCNTPEFFADVKARLNNGGVIVVNHFDTTSRAGLLANFDPIFRIKIHLNQVYFCQVDKGLTLPQIQERVSKFIDTNKDFEIFRGVEIEEVTT